MKNINESEKPKYALIHSKRRRPKEKLRTRVIKMVRSVTIYTSDEPSSLPKDWIVTVRTDLNPGTETNMETYSAHYWSCARDIEQLEPGMFVTIDYYNHMYNLGESMKDDKNNMVIVVNKISINHEKTQTERTKFDFYSVNDKDGIISHKQMIKPV